MKSTQTPPASTRTEDKPSKVADNSPAQPSDEWMGAWEAYKQAIKSILKQPAFILIYTAISTLITYFSYTGALQNETLFNVSFFLSILPSIVFVAALPRYSLAIADNRVISLGELMRFDKRFLYALAASIMLSIVFFVSLLAFIIPIIWTFAWYAYTLFPIVESGTTPGNALDHSKNLGKNRKTELWEIMIVPILLTMLSLFLTGGFKSEPDFNLTTELIMESLGSLLFMVIFSTIAILYRWLQKQPTTKEVVKTDS